MESWIIVVKTEEQLVIDENQAGKADGALSGQRRGQHAPRRKKEGGFCLPHSAVESSQVSLELLSGVFYVESLLSLLSLHAFEESLQCHF